MKRSIVRTYVFSEREVHEALIAMLKAKDVPAPGYVADTPNCKWTWRRNSIIECVWTDSDEVQLP